MTRLRGEWMARLIAELDGCERGMIEKTGLDFAGLAAAANGLAREELIAASRDMTVAVVSVTQGEGVIPDFARSVAAIIERAGFDAFVCDRTDVDGIYEAYARGANAVFMADDARYVGMRLDRRRVADNNECTARGYVTLLEAAAGALAGRTALVIGCGIIGREAGKCLVAKGAKPVYYDSDTARLENMRAAGLATIDNASRIREFSLVFDATNTGGWLSWDMLYDNAWIASPGVPLSLDGAAMARHGARVIHDELEAGTLCMLGALMR